MHAYSCFPFTPGSLLHVSGEDALDFLQGQFSNDLRGRTPLVSYGFWLNHKGRIVADSHVLAMDKDAFLVCSAVCPSQGLLDRLEPYIIADDVSIRDETPDWQLAAAWSVCCDRPGRMHHPPPGELQALNGGWLWNPGWSGAEVLFFLCPKGSSLPEGWREAEGEAGEQWHGVRLRAGVPLIPSEFGPNDLPQEFVLGRSSVSYQKGCYTGQEVMARLHHMGQTRRELVRVKVHGPVSPPLRLLGPDRPVGEVRAWHPSGIGLAIVQKSFLARQPLPELRTDTPEPQTVLMDL